MSFLDQISFDLNERTNTYARRISKRFTKFANIYVFYNVLKSNKRVNNCIAYIVVQIFALKRSLFDIILFVNNRDSFDTRVLFANNNNAKEESKLDSRLKQSLCSTSRLYISIYLFSFISISTQFAC